MFQYAELLHKQPILNHAVPSSGESQISEDSEPPKYNRNRKLTVSY